MKILCAVCNRVTVVPLTNASCFGIRIPYLREFCWRKVCYRSSSEHCPDSPRSDICIGIDVQAELEAKSGGPAIHPGQVAPPVTAPAVPSPPQRTAVNRKYTRRSYPALAQSQVMPGSSAASQNERGTSLSGPSLTHGQPTPSSHASSPNVLPGQSPASGQHAGMTPPGSGLLAHGQSSSYRSPHQTDPSQSHIPHQSIQRPSSTQYANASGVPTIPGDSYKAVGIAEGQGVTAYPSPFQPLTDQDQLGRPIIRYLY